VRQIPYSHHLQILGQCKLPEEREFNLRMAVQESWSKRQLERQIWAALFDRTALTPPKVAPVVREIHPKALSVFRDSYAQQAIMTPMQSGAFWTRFSAPAGRTPFLETLATLRRLPTGLRLAIRYLWLEDHATGRGIARTMCQHSKEQTKRSGFRAMQFNFVVSTNERAVKLWQGLRLEIEGRLPLAFAQPSMRFVDGLVMSADL